MTMTSARTRRPSKRSIIAAVAGTAILAAVVIGVVVGGDGDGQALEVIPAAQVSSIEHGCQEWSAQPGNGTDDAAACAGLGDWMTAHMNSAGMGPQLMWGSSGRLEDTCRQWAAEDPTGKAAAGQDWCTSMVRWMSGHMDEWTGRADWDDWMMHGLMGRHGPGGA